MIKIYFYRDIPNSKKIKGIVIKCGYRCNSACWCDKANQCKYNKRYIYHNASVKFHQWFEYKLHIKLPNWIYFGRINVDLSGTEKCPFHKSRHYTCWDCLHTDGQIDGNCLNPKRTMEDALAKFDDPDWHCQGKCRLFEKNSWADNWNKETGEYFF